jgi:hypothetical protein
MNLDTMLMTLGLPVPESLYTCNPIVNLGFITYMHAILHNSIVTGNAPLSLADHGLPLPIGPSEEAQKLLNEDALSDADEGV